MNGIPTRTQIDGSPRAISVAVEESTTPTPPQFTPTEWARIVLALHLPPQQANVVALVLQNNSDKEMAKVLDVSEETVNAHLRRIYARLEVNGRLALALQIFETAKQLATQYIPRTGSTRKGG